MHGKDRNSRYRCETLTCISEAIAGLQFTILHITRVIACNVHHNEAHKTTNRIHLLQVLQHRSIGYMFYARMIHFTLIDHS